jgi:hypothetical protein
MLLVIAWARSFAGLRSPALAAFKMRSASIERVTFVWPSGNRDQASSLYHHLCAYPPTFRFQQSGGGDVPATTIRERSNAASIYRAQVRVLRCHVWGHPFWARLITYASSQCAFSPAKNP